MKARIESIAREINNHLAMMNEVQNIDSDLESGDVELSVDAPTKSDGDRSIRFQIHVERLYED